MTITSPTQPSDPLFETLVAHVENPTTTTFNTLAHLLTLENEPRWDVLFFTLASKRGYTVEQLLYLAQHTPGLSEIFVKQIQQYATQFGLSYQQKIRAEGISAVMRVHNEEEYLFQSISSIYRMVDEIIVVLHQCTDASEAILLDLIAQGFDKIKLFHYHQSTAQAGLHYRQSVIQGQGSLSEYYNTAFGYANYSHVLKWDGDMIAFPNLASALEKARAEGVLALRFCGFDVLDLPNSAGVEPRYYKISENTLYFDAEESFEVLYTPYNATPNLVLQTSTPLYLHMKPLKKTYRNLGQIMGNSSERIDNHA